MTQRVKRAERRRRQAAREEEIDLKMEEMKARILAEDPVSARLKAALDLMDRIRSRQDQL